MPKLTVISSSEAPTVDDLTVIVSQLKPKLVMIDSFYMLQRRGVDSTWEKTLRNVEDIKLKIANDFDVPTVISSQLKGTVSKDTVNADSDDAAYAKAIGDTADATRGFFATEEHVRNNRRIWRSMESREFRGIDLLINFNLSTMDFSEIQVLDGSDDTGDGDVDGDDGDEDGGGDDAFADKRSKKSRKSKPPGLSDGGEKIFSI
jgi:hypothetical protein